VSTIPAIASVGLTRARPLLQLCVLLGALALTGCGADGLPSPITTTSPAGSPMESSGASPVTSEAPGITPEATPRPTEPPGPPVAGLVVAGGVPAPGALGSYVWDGAGSDAPWLVPPASAGVRARGPYAVTVVPPLPIDRWEAAWARIEGDVVGSPEGAASGGEGRVSVPGPGAAGTWSLVVDIRFAGGNHAAWYWRIDVLP